MSGTATEWLAFASDDLRMAEWALEAEIFAQTCFHSQQCVEKSLKAILVHIGQNSPRTHAIADLLNLLPATWKSNLPQRLIELDALYTSTRYPDALPGTLPTGLPDRSRAKEALAWAHDVFDQAQLSISTNNG